jgi:hypothetical protein
MATNDERASALREAMRAANIDAATLAEKCGLDLDVIGYYVAGKIHGYTTEWWSIAEVLGVQGWDLMDGKIVPKGASNPR